jgi:hypothetical protein
MTYKKRHWAPGKKFSAEMVEKCYDYINQFHPQYEGEKLTEEVVPTVAGMAVYIGVSRRTITNWKNPDKFGDDENFNDFQNVYDLLKGIYETNLVNKGLTAEYQPMIVKVLLAQLGYSDSTKIDNTSSDGSMTPAPVVDKEVVSALIDKLID